MAKLSIVMPCYQVGDNIPVTMKEVFKAEDLFPAATTFEYVLVNDGSTDHTFSELVKVQQQYPDKVKIVNLTRNFGAINALMAGLSQVTGDCCGWLAADLQDPPELMAKMMDYWQKGLKVVVANRANREEGLQITFFSGIYHFVMGRVIPKKVPPGGFDLMLLDRQVVDELNTLAERNTYLPYLVMWLGYDYVNIPYTRRRREIGQSMWTFSKKIKAFIDSVVAFSFAPIRAISIFGFMLGFAAFSYLCLILYHKLSGGYSVEGWTSLMVVFLVVSCFQMIALGIIGEYVWRTLDSTRGRPNFVIDEVIAGRDNSQQLATLEQARKEKTG